MTVVTADSLDDYEDEDEDFVTPWDRLLIFGRRLKDKLRQKWFHIKTELGLVKPFTGFTLECWVHPTKSNSGIFLHYCGFSVSLSPSLTVSVYPFPVLVTGWELEIGVWSHIALTESTLELAVYHNGVKCGWVQHTPSRIEYWHDIQ